MQRHVILSEAKNPMLVKPEDSSVARSFRMTDAGVTQLISPGAAYLTLQMLRELNRPGSEYYWQQYQNQRPLAWKTGTSYGQRDAWAVGVNPQWTIAVWVGNFDGEGNSELAGSRSAGPILFDLFNMLPKDKKQAWFERPESGLSTVELCAWSGYKATENCPQTIRVDAPRSMGYMRLCPWHQTIFVNDAENQQVCSLCWQPGHYHPVKRLILPPDIVQYLRRQGQIVEKVPLHNPDCPAEQNEQAMQIIYPTANARIWLPRDYGGVQQKVTLKAAHRNSRVKIYWYLDNHYLGETIETHSMSLNLANGKHTLVLVDAFGRRVKRDFYSTKAE